MYDEIDDQPRGTCPRCGNVYYDLDTRRGGEVPCDCGAKLLIVYPDDVEAEAPKVLPD